VLSATPLCGGINILTYPLEGSDLPSGRSLVNPLVSLRAGPEGSCCQGLKVVVTLTAGVQHACVFPGPHVILHHEAHVFIPVCDSGR
jgi:hypothetical protein